MLRIEKVHLQGFKSFCDSTEVVFDQEAITAVVGPNGCGKSNVADALNWVIGEQRAKALRGGKMEDVIFQGSRNRQPAGMAEVVLTLRVSDAFEIRTQENVKSDYMAAAAGAAAPLDATLDTGAVIDTAVVSNAAVRNDVVDIEVRTQPEQGKALETGSERPRTFPSTTTRQYAPGERITIARRLYRTGESEYEMNGKLCRLREIQDLFAGTGLGASHYAIIEQGRIGQVLSAKPLDRRGLIEEAAGISKFKSRQHSAELKLEAARLNLARLNDIIVEVDRQQNSLKRQAAKAKRYQRLRHNLRLLSRRVFVADFRYMNSQVVELDRARQDNVAHEADLGSRLADAEAERVETNSKLNEFEHRLLGMRAASNETTVEIEKGRQQHQYLTEQVEALGRRLATSARDRELITGRGEFTGLEVERLLADQRDLEEELNVDAAALAHAESDHQEQAKHEREVELILEQTQASVREAATLRERWRQLVRQFGESVERAARQLEGLESERVRALSQEESFTGELAALTEELGGLDAVLSETITSLGVAEASLELRHQERRRLEKEVTASRTELTTAEQRLKSLSELDQQKSHYSEAVQAIMRQLREVQPAPFEVLGTLADFVEVGPAQEKMVEMGLREEMQFLVVRTFADALAAIEYLKGGNYGRATFLVLDNGLPSASIGDTSAGEVSRLVDVLGLRPDLRNVLRQALPRLADAVVLEEVSSAIELSIRSNGSGHSFLTPGGEFISAGHLISGGSVSEGGIGVLALRREIGELMDRVAGIGRGVAATEAELAMRVEGIERETLVRQSLADRAHQVEKDLVALRGRKEQSERELERAKNHLRVVEKEHLVITGELDELGKKLTHAEGELGRAEATLTGAEAESQRAQMEVSSLRQLALERTQELSRRRADFAAKSERRKALHNEIRRLQNEAQDISRQLSRSQLEAVESAELAESHQATLIRLEAALLENQERLAEQRAGLSEVEELVAMEKAKSVSIEELLGALRNGVAAVRETRSEIDISKTRLSSALEYLASNCYAELGETIDELVARFAGRMDRFDRIESGAEAVGFGVEEVVVSLPDGEEDEVEVVISADADSLPEDFDLESARLELNVLKTRIDGLGPVNLLALQELGELEERLAFLLEQKADVETAVADTHSAILEIKKRSRDRFLEAFNQINRNFSELFLELFGGGHGEMRLIDETDVLESGIDIIAQPPGKRLQNVLLLSGGEKAMAALALVMGIFKYRPSPFCLLDEVDAPLDDVNIGRFADKIVEMSGQTQFMIITHSKRTMEAAKTLYGVTMEDPGVSKLISVRLT